MCPECGGKAGQVKQTGYDDQDRILRRRVCPVCDHRYATVEVPVPASYFQLADSHRWRQLYRARLVRGYHGMKQGTYRRRRPRLVVDVKVVAA